MAFTGTFEHNLDTKNRLTIPSKFRAELSKGIYLSRAIENVISLYPAETYTAMADQALAGTGEPALSSEGSMSSPGGRLDRFFRLTERGTSPRVEILGGVTTFAAMAYIVVVNPAILHFAGIPAGPSTVATILTAAVGSLLMGLYANRPLGVAPYMGENAFLAFGLAALGIGWQLRLGAVFVAGVVFLLLTLVRLRGWLAKRGVRSNGEPEYAFYNSPMIPGPLRRNEVWLAIS